jgi:WD40 repeat protein
MQHHGVVYSVAFNADGTFLLTASEDHTARVWLTASGRPFTPPLPHWDEVFSAVFSPDGSEVLTGSKDHTARVWSLAVDRDEPPALFNLEAELLTERQLSPDGVPQSLTADALRDKQAQWNDLAQAHARTCHFPEANLWLHR